MVLVVTILELADTVTETFSYCSLVSATFRSISFRVKLEFSSRHQASRLCQFRFINLQKLSVVSLLWRALPAFLPQQLPKSYFIHFVSGPPTYLPTDSEANR